MPNEMYLERDDSFGRHLHCNPLDTLEVVVKTPLIKRAVRELQKGGISVDILRQCVTCGDLIVLSKVGDGVFEYYTVNLDEVKGEL